jgi:hypothetical protein
MLIQQTHFPNKGPNWGGIILVTLAVVALGVMAYNTSTPSNFKFNKEK